ncbi:hypothetical protein NPIL_241771, partial [Nephila pilipes]
MSFEELNSDYKDVSENVCEDSNDK